MADGTRERFITATIELLRVHGYNATSLKDVTVKAGAPIGSLYHHFKGGKDELTAAALSSAGEAYLNLFVMVWEEAGNPVAAVEGFFDGAASVLAETDFIDPCPIGGVAREVASTNPLLRETAAAIFTSWVDEVERRFAAAGASDQECKDLSMTLIAAVEGGFVLSRTARDADVMRQVGRTTARMVAEVMERVSSP